MKNSFRYVHIRNSFRYVGEVLASVLPRLGARLLVGSFPANIPSDGLLEVAQGAVRNAGILADDLE